jgi:hypothetical protein
VQKIFSSLKIRDCKWLKNTTTVVRKQLIKKIDQKMLFHTLRQVEVVGKIWKKSAMILTLGINGLIWLDLTHLTHFDSFWFILIHFDSFWLILTHFDSFWLILTHFDSFWLILTHFAHFDLFWLILTYFDSFWLILTHFDSFWLILIQFDSVWFNLTQLD